MCLSDNENLALYVLHHHWHKLEPGRYFIPEHIERRELYVRDKPGVSQGSIAMFVHMFLAENTTIPLPIDVTPRAYKTYVRAPHVSVFGGEQIRIARDRLEH